MPPVFFYTYHGGTEQTKAYRGSALMNADLNKASL